MANLSNMAAVIRWRSGNHGVGATEYINSLNEGQDNCVELLKLNRSIWISLRKGTKNENYPEQKRF